VILANVLRGMFKRDGLPAGAPQAQRASTGSIVLNVGGNSKDIPIPGHCAGWTHLLLDIDPTGNPDIVCDARVLDMLTASQFDAVYCSHNPEHYYKHDAAQVLRGFLHVLKPDGFAEIRVPDLLCVMQHVVATGMDIEDTLYVSAAGPIAVRDVLYGLGRQIEESGEDFFAHKTGFTPTTLSAFLRQAGFAQVFVQPRKEAFEVRAVAFKAHFTPQQRATLAV
jgi:hypothetical protein